MRLPILLIPILFSPLSQGATTSVVFDSNSDLYRDFRITGNGANLVPIQESGSTYIRHNGLNTQSAFVYDLNANGPGTTAYNIAVGDTLSVSTQIRFTGTNASTTHNSSFGFIFGNTTNGHLAIINLNQSGGNEQFRISDNAATLSGGFGSLPTSGNPGYLAGVNAIGPDTFTTVTATYEVLTSTSYRISLAAGGQTVTRDFTGSLSDIQIGLRMNNGSADRFLDVNIIPEPGVSALTLGSLALLTLRRRR